MKQKKSTVAETIKPRCEDFIIAAIRVMRVKHPNLKPNTKTGLQLRKVFLAARELYDPQEFRDALQKLMRQKSVVVCAGVSTTKRLPNKPESYEPRRNILISVIPSGADIAEACWWLSPTGEKVDHATAQEYRFFSDIRLYVKADGLPDVAKKLFANKGRTLAEQIVASIK